MILAEEMASIRQKSEQKLIALKKHMMSIRDNVEYTLNDINVSGIDTDFSKLNNLREYSDAVIRLVKSIKEQRSVIEQTIFNLRQIKKNGDI